MRTDSVRVPQSSSLSASMSDARARSLSATGTESSRSNMTMSAPLSVDFSRNRGFDAGTESCERLGRIRCGVTMVKLKGEVLPWPTGAPEYTARREPPLQRNGVLAPPLRPGLRRASGWARWTRLCSRSAWTWV